MGLFNKENKNKFNIDSYFSMVVQNFVNERTIDNYIDVCKVLQYRKFYVAYETTFFDHHLRVILYLMKMVRIYLYKQKMVNYHFEDL